MAASSYGAYQPGAVDPWPIESVLAKEAITSPADAQGLLSSYAQQRQAQGYIYGQEADRQHDFAKQQLLAQMQEARNKLIPELVGKPGGGAFLAGGGIQGVGPGDGGNAAAWAGLGQAGQQHDFAQNLDLTGKGIEALSRAGQDLPIQQITGLQNFQTTGAGEHSDITVERIKAATALQQAAAHAARKAKEPTFSVPYKGNITDIGDTIAPTLKFTGNETDAELAAKKAKADRVLRAMYPNQAGVAGGSGGGNSFGATQLGNNPAADATATTTAAPSKTSLPRASSPAPSTPAPTGRGTAPAFVTDPVLQNRSREMYKLLPPAAQQQVWANRPGGVNMPIVQTPQGIVFVGKDGKGYAVPQPGAK
jgi:hypothetical protein